PLRHRPPPKRGPRQGRRRDRRHPGASDLRRKTGPVGRVGSSQLDPPPQSGRARPGESVAEGRRQNIECRHCEDQVISPKLKFYSTSFVPRENSNRGQTVFRVPTSVGTLNTVWPRKT